MRRAGAGRGLWAWPSGSARAEQRGSGPFYLCSGSGSQQSSNACGTVAPATGLVTLVGTVAWGGPGAGTTARKPRQRGPRPPRATPTAGMGDSRAQSQSLHRVQRKSVSRVSHAGPPPSASLAPPTDPSFLLLGGLAAALSSAASCGAPSIAACRGRPPGVQAPGTHLRDGGVCTASCVSDASGAPRRAESGRGAGRGLALNSGCRGGFSPAPQVPAPSLAQPPGGSITACPPCQAACPRAVSCRGLVGFCGALAGDKLKGHFFPEVGTNCCVTYKCSLT